MWYLGKNAVRHQESYRCRTAWERCSIVARRYSAPHLHNKRIMRSVRRTVVLNPVAAITVLLLQQRHFNARVSLRIILAALLGSIAIGASSIVKLCSALSFEVTGLCICNLEAQNPHLKQSLKERVYKRQYK